MGIFEKFKLGFKKSASTFASGLKDIIVKKEIDDETLNKIEDYLIQSDVGTGAASEIKDVIAQEKIDPKKNIMDEVNTILKNYIITVMKPLENENFLTRNRRVHGPCERGFESPGAVPVLRFFKTDSQMSAIRPDGAGRPCRLSRPASKRKRA